MCVCVCVCVCVTGHLDSAEHAGIEDVNAGVDLVGDEDLRLLHKAFPSLDTSYMREKKITHRFPAAPSRETERCESRAEEKTGKQSVTAD
ncbi:hypothetical protein EYF80_063104 [Liparis tanakae]|uniref:Uncharacterized protein n=1 Tax=Liparis tanakae TaxID=230148 RepID=A0A4Z2EDD3_9TELE|nr:hypothetical protein EYF80_063104 [Liparis tanakae]